MLFAKSNSDFEPSYVLSSANFSPDSRPDFFRESGAGAGVAKRGSRGEKSGAGVTPDATLMCARFEGLFGWVRIPPSTNFFFSQNIRRMDSENLTGEFLYPGNPNPGSDSGYRVRKIPISVPDPIFPPKYRKRMDIESGD